MHALEESIGFFQVQEVSAVREFDEPGVRHFRVHLSCPEGRSDEVVGSHEHEDGRIDDAQLARLHAPVGLPIGAVSTGEIAVSVMAEIVAVRRGRKLQAVKT